ncbi:MAG TPA: manganese ABC transporter ATP-binding protein [Rhodospirillaceae bacterium]|nr:manganese ABC transporter ATP-binding protein [Rhodospirillaceae bacterium]
MPSPLSVSNLSVHYRLQDEPALSGIDFEAKQSSLIAVIGPNGAGKSTFLKAAMGLIPCTGEVKFFGEKLDSQRNKIAYMPQRSSVDWDFPISALDVAAMGLYGQIGFMRRVKKEHKDKALSYLEQVGMADYAGRQIGQLSGGQQQRVFLARTLAQNAELYLMDEPLSGVDMASEKIIIDILIALKKQGKTILVVHHDLQSVGSFFDEALLLNRTKISEGPIKTVLSAGNLARAYKMPVIADVA